MDWHMTPEGPKRFGPRPVPFNECPHDTLEVGFDEHIQTYTCPMCTRAVGMAGYWMIQHSLAQIWEEIVKVFGERWRDYPEKFPAMRPGRLLDVRTGSWDIL